jgi:hypothetical protein
MSRVEAEGGTKKRNFGGAILGPTFRLEGMEGGRMSGPSQVLWHGCGDSARCYTCLDAVTGHRL